MADMISWEMAKQRLTRSGFTVTYTRGDSFMGARLGSRPIDYIDVHNGKVSRLRVTEILDKHGRTGGPSTPFMTGVGK